MVRAQTLRLTQPGFTAPFGAQVGRWCRITVADNARIVLGERAIVDDGVTLAAGAGSRLEIGPRSFIGHHSTIAAAELVRIGVGTFLAEMVSVRDHDHDETQQFFGGGQVTEPVTIGDDVWLASKVTVCRGSSIGDGVIVGANSVVRGTIEASAVAVGSPAVVRRERRRTESDRH